MEAERGEREVGRTEFIVRLYGLYKVWDKGSSLLYWCQDIAGRFWGARHRRLLIMESKILESIIVMSLTPSVVLLSLAEARYLIESSTATIVSSVPVHMDRMHSSSLQGQICCKGTTAAS
jgi:hypothetical protein